MKTLFITGGTGVIGRNIVRYYLENTNHNIIILTHSNAYECRSDKFLEEVGLDISKSERLILLKGDITKENLGISLDSLDTKSITEVIHSAASTEFDLPLEEIRKINVIGTQNVINFSLNCENLSKFAFLGTVYSSGKSVGLIPAGKLDEPPGFVNTYEQSKYEAELILEKYFDKLNISIYRFSTIVGNSIDGSVRNYTAPHQALRIFYLGLASMIPGTEDYVVDLIPEDNSSTIFCELFDKHFMKSKYYNICAGDNNSYTLREIIDKSFEYIGEVKPSWKDLKIQKPEIVNEETFNLFSESVSKVENPLFSNILDLMKHFAHQLNYPKKFETNNIKDIIPDYSKRIRYIDDYYKKVVKYCIENRWR